MKVSLGKVVANQRSTTLSMFESNAEPTEWLRVEKKNKYIYMPGKGSEMLCFESQSNGRRHEL